MGKRLGRTVINKIASVYSKTDDYGNNNIKKFVLNQINSGNLLDASAKKAPIWFTASRLQLPHAVQTIINANSIIPDSPENVNTSDEKIQFSREVSDVNPANARKKNPSIADIERRLPAPIA